MGNVISSLNKWDGKIKFLYSPGNTNAKLCCRKETFVCILVINNQTAAGYKSFHFCYCMLVLTLF